MSKSRGVQSCRVQVHPCSNTLVCNDQDLHELLQSRLIRMVDLQEQDLKTPGTRPKKNELKTLSRLTSIEKRGGLTERKRLANIGCGCNETICGMKVSDGQCN